jgi:hypothetical protein
VINDSIEYLPTRTHFQHPTNEPTIKWVRHAMPVRREGDGRPRPEDRIGLRRGLDASPEIIDTASLQLGWGRAPRRSVSQFSFAEAGR